MDFWPVLQFSAERKNGCFSVFPVQTPFIVIQDYFFGDPDYLTEFCRNRVEIRGTFPSEVPTAKIGQNLAQRPKTEHGEAKRPPTGKLKLSRVTSGCGGNMAFFSRTCLSPKNMAYMGVA